MQITISFEIKFSCNSNASWTCLLCQFWSLSVKLLETVTPSSKRMERQSTPSIAGEMSLHKSLSPQKEKSWNFTPNMCASVVERLVKNKRFALKFASLAFFRALWWGLQERPLARWFASGHGHGPNHQPLRNAYDSNADLMKSCNIKASIPYTYMMYCLLLEPGLWLSKYIQ